ncbi:IclR family transcriptional regulator [Primorskyibacter sedentarius]|uniref:IclR family transcriptional regulator n=1 Tax=Primorskyibacter sedentarius TaxID=745311 RepID=A0A4V2UM47_9RHOB|nr:IclR family transcriptional regulator [Primorskyibacter sedentarius]TCS54735.1 IclR family transcriptional regulator [Primorskyibacter sedentarius]
MAGDDGKESAIPTNLRLLLVLEAMAEAGVPVTPTEVNQKLGLPKPTIHRLFTTLETEGFIQREIDGRGYSPGQRVRKMSTGILSSLRIRTARIAILAQLAEEIGETSNISIPDRDAMVYLDRVETKWPLRIQLSVGTRVPFYCTAGGKMYLSSLDRRHLRNYALTAKLDPLTDKTITDPEALIEEAVAIRERGYATDDKEFMADMVAVAVPILDSNGRLVSTLSFHAPELRLSIGDAIDHVDRLKQSAARLSELLHEPDPQEASAQGG